MKTKKILSNNGKQFHDMGLDDRILEGIAQLGWFEPTLIQSKAIPYVLQGKDILAQGRTGSGKTGAFAIPILHDILESKSHLFQQVTKALILAPSGELCKQIGVCFHQLSIKCQREFKIVDISSQEVEDGPHPLLKDNPDVVIGTPDRVLLLIKSKNLNLQNLQFLVIDEADLMFTFSHDADLKAIIKLLPKIFQSFVTSATITSDVKKLKKLVFQNSVILQLDEPPLPNPTQLAHYAVTLEEFEKAVLLCTVFSLDLVRGKTIIFVNGINKGYKLKIFLAQFNVQAQVLNCEMPLESRYYIVSQFNTGNHDIIIATDEHKEKTTKREKVFSKSVEVGVSRGIDFQLVSNVINFDFPCSTNSYIHRVGRTARGTNRGTALSFVSQRENDVFLKLQKKLTQLQGEDLIFKDFKFDLKQLDGFRYRAKDAWAQCTAVMIADVRKKEIQQEILKSEKLKAYFQSHPDDLRILQSGIFRKTINLRLFEHIPEYNMPEGLQHVKRKKETDEFTESEEQKKAKFKRKEKKHWKHVKKMVSHFLSNLPNI